MSEEEKQAIETMNTIIEFGGDNLLCKEHRKQLQTILKLIKKQQKEIEELKKENEEGHKQLLIDTAEEVLKWKGNYYLLSRKIDVVSKDKIRAKIKELEEKSDYWNCDEIEILKELLEE